jgi:hypothetical protein
MNSQTVVPQKNRLIEQPTNWPLLFLLPETHYVRRRRAANSPEYSPTPLAEVLQHRSHGKRLSYLQRVTHYFSSAKHRAWLSLKQFGRELVHKLVRWCVLPLAIAACFSMLDATPAEMPGSYYDVEKMVQIETSHR